MTVADQPRTLDPKCIHALDFQVEEGRNPTGKRMDCTRANLPLVLPHPFLPVTNFPCFVDVPLFHHSCNWKAESESWRISEILHRKRVAFPANLPIDSVKNMSTNSLKVMSSVTQNCMIHSPFSVSYIWVFLSTDCNHHLTFWIS